MSAASTVAQAVTGLPFIGSSDDGGSSFKPSRLNPFEGSHGLPDPMGWVRGSKEYIAKNQKPQAPELPPPPPGPPQLPEVSGEAAQARVKAKQGRSGGIFTSPSGVPSGSGGSTTAKTLLGQ